MLSRESGEDGESQARSQARYEAWDAAREAGVRNAGLVFLRISALVRAMYGPVAAVLTLAQGYDLRFLELVLAFGIALRYVALDLRVSPVFEAIEAIAAVNNDAAHPMQSRSYRFKDGSVYTPDCEIAITEANEQQVRSLFTAIGLPAPLIASIIARKVFMSESKCNCRVLSGYDGELLRLLQVAEKLRTEMSITLVILSFSEISLHVCTLADATSNYALDVHLQCVFQGEHATPQEALEKVNKVMACDSQRSYHAAFRETHGYPVFSRHATTNAQFGIAHVHGRSVPGFHACEFRGVRMAHPLPASSLFYDAGPYLPPDDVAKLVAPHLAYLPHLTREALIRLPQYQAAMSGASSTDPVFVN